MLGKRIFITLILSDSSKDMLISFSGKSLQECLCLYFIKMKDNTFLGNRPYPNEPLEKMLKQCFGADTVMAEIAYPKKGLNLA